MKKVFSKRLGVYQKVFLIWIGIVSFYVQAKGQKDTAKIGCYISSLYDFNLSENTFKTDFYLWSIYNKNAPFNFEKEIEIMNTNSVSMEGTSVDTTGNSLWFYSKIKAELRKIWRTVDYPFDRQRLLISIESSEYDTSGLVFLCDKKNSKMNDSAIIRLNEWELLGSSFFVTSTKYDTNFGNPESEASSSNSCFNIEISLARKNSWLILFKLITGLLVAFTISCCVFFIKPNNVDPRFGLAVGGLFAAIGNKYIVEGIVPSTNSVTMMDSIHNLTFIYLFIIIIVSVYSLYLYEKETAESRAKSIKVDRYSLIAIFFSYFLTLTGILYSHLG